MTIHINITQNYEIMLGGSKSNASNNFFKNYSFKIYVQQSHILFLHMQIYLLTLNILHYLRTETNSPSPLVTQLNKIKTRKQPTSSKPKIYTTPTVNKHPKRPN